MIQKHYNMRTCEDKYQLSIKYYGLTWHLSLHTQKSKFTVEIITIDVMYTFAPTPKTQLPKLKNTRKLLIKNLHINSHVLTCTEKQETKPPNQKSKSTMEDIKTLLTVKTLYAVCIIQPTPRNHIQEKIYKMPNWGASERWNSTSSKLYAKVLTPTL